MGTTAIMLLGEALARLIRFAVFLVLVLGLRRGGGAVIDAAANELFRACGVPAAFDFVTGLRPATLGGDFDGDDSLDDAALVRRSADGRHALFVCRAGTWSHLLALDTPLGDLDTAYLAEVDY